MRNGWPHVLEVDERIASGQDPKLILDAEVESVTDSEQDPQDDTAQKVDGVFVQYKDSADADEGKPVQEATQEDRCF